jgi:hypothetical protein
MKDVFEFLVDGTSGLAPGGVEGACIVVGVCSLGEVGKAYLLGKSSDLESLLGVGPLVDRLRDAFAAGGQGPVVIAVPATGQGGSVTAVVKTGTGPDIATSGTPKADAEVLMKILIAGARNVGTYQLSLDGGDSWGPERTIPVDGAIAVGTTGVTITFPDISDAVAGDLYAFTVIAPAPSISAVMEALEQPLSLYDVEFVYVAGPSDSTDWAAMGAKADELWNAHRPTFFLAETRLPAAGEDLDDWTAAMMVEGAGYAHRFVAVCVAFGEISDATGKRLTRNAAGLLAGRLLSIPVMRAPGRVRDGAVSQLSMPDLYTEAHQSQLETAGYVTARRYAGLSGTYWGDERTLADVTSDYQYLTVLRTVFKAVRKSRIAALKSMYDEAGDPVLEGGAVGLEYLKTSLETALNTLVSAVPRELAGHVVTIPPGQDIVNNGVAVEMTLIGIPIIRTIKLFASYVYAGGSFDPRLN